MTCLCVHVWSVWVCRYWLSVGAQPTVAVHKLLGLVSTCVREGGVGGDAYVCLLLCRRGYFRHILACIWKRHIRGRVIQRSRVRMLTQPRPRTLMKPVRLTLNSTYHSPVSIEYKYHKHYQYWGCSLAVDCS